jgi:dihydrofolate reductase
MRNLIYSMSVSLDGFITDPGGGIDWTAPDEELHRFHNERVREQGVQLLGRRLYEAMLYWETAHEDPAATDVTLEFARIWQELPRVVFSTTLQEVEGNARLARADPAQELAQLREQPGKDIAVGGAGLAAAFARANLIDEYQLFVCPVALGGGTPFFPALDERIDLELVETRTFGSRVVYMHYRRR